MLRLPGPPLAFAVFSGVRRPPAIGVTPPAPVPILLSVLRM